VSSELLSHLANIFVLKIRFLPMHYYTTKCYSFQKNYIPTFTAWALKHLDKIA
jgi:hypothetical protein